MTSEAKDKNYSAAMNTEVLKIAAETLGIPTLDTRNSGDLDFHELSVWNIKIALMQAYLAGYSQAPL